MKKKLTEAAVIKKMHEIIEELDQLSKTNPEFSCLVLMNVPEVKKGSQHADILVKMSPATMAEILQKDAPLIKFVTSAVSHALMKNA